MKNTTYIKHEVPESYIEKWQYTVNLMARIFDVPAGLIMRVSPEEIEVLIASKTENNPYEPNEKFDLDTGLYCETVMSKRSQLCVENALEDDDWRNNPDVTRNMLFYLGIPLIWPDGNVFGTICILDDKTRSFSKLYHDLLWQFKEVIETDFHLIVQADKLEEYQAQLEDLVEKRTIALKQEISERKHKEKELVLLATAIEQAGESIVITDKTGTIQYVNPFFEQTTGYSREQAVGQNPRILQSGEHGISFYKSMWNTLSNGKIWHGRLINKKKDGSLYEEEATISPILDRNGTITNYVAVKRDITDQVKLRKQLNQAQKMESIGTLAGGIAHDFNNILTCILGYADMILEKLPEDSDLRRDQAQIIKAGNRAKELVKQILAFSRQTEEERIPLAIHIIVKEAIKLLRSSIPTTIEIKQNIDPGVGMVLADRTQLHQIVMNLCTNAYYAMRETGGTLAITLFSCQIDGDDIKVSCPGLTPGAYVKLKISDTGCGMDKKTMENIFDPYFTTKNRGEGTGLGLAMVHGIVKTYDGHITVYSKLGKGTTFHVYLPQFMQEKVVEAQKEDKLPYPTGTEKILIVDDEEVIVQMERQMLESLGYTVFAHTDSKELLRTFQNAPQDFDLIITDMTMPKLTGADLSQLILAIRPDIPIILCTGFSALIDKEKSVAAGISEYIMKPVTKRDLAEVVREALDSNKPHAT